MINEDVAITDIYKSFNKDNVILFLGSDALKNGELTEKVYSLPWNCVITTIKKEGFGIEFPSERNPHRYLSLSELPANLFNRDNLSIIQMLGSDTEMPIGAEDLDDFLLPSFLKKHAEKILNRVMSKMDIRSLMVVVGYNPESVEDIPIDTFMLSCQELQGGRIAFFNSGKYENSVLKQFADKNHFTWVNGKFSDVLLESTDEFETRVGLLEDNTNLFYKGHQPVSIKKSILLRSKNYAQLLTEEKINEIRPVGKIQRAKWFYNFLNNSSDAPQWYGFLPQSEYYLKRSYEDELLTLVHRLLAGKGLNKNGENTPIVLEGDPGSSKSIELAGVAYKIFIEKNNPVIFINDDSLFFSSQSNEIQVLDELMQEVEQIGEKDTRFLIVWDSSAYKNIIADAKQLTHELENRGRRFVLLCSAYINLQSDKERNNRIYYSFQKDSIFEKTDLETDIYFYNRCYFISATRNLEQMEINILKEKALQYAIVERSEIDHIWKELNGNTDIFEYFYRLITLIRPKLEAGLSREQRLINRYIRKQFALIEKKEEDTCFNPIVEALKNAGIELDEETKKELIEEEMESDYDLDKFNVCIAMFSRFKLDTPYSLALRMLCKNKDSFFGSNKNYNNYELFQLLTSQINYIHYCEQGEGRYVFRFRSVLEAEIFLKNNQVNEKNQLEIVEELIDHYADYYRRCNEIDYEIKDAIQAILKMYGPNTEYKEFWSEHPLYQQHQVFLKELKPLAEKIHELRVKDKIPDDDGGMALIEISFYRELYGNLWDKLNGYSRAQSDNREPWEVYPEIYTPESYLMRLNKLAEVASLALESLDKLDLLLNESRDFFSQRAIQMVINSLTVELAVSNSEMERIGEEYTKLESKNDVNLMIKPLTYTQLYPILFKAISASPLDGYLYNALFKIFEKEYEKSGDERKLYLLSDVRMIADDASTLEIANRGAYDKDELSVHLHKIIQYSCSYVVKIDDVTNNIAPESFMKLFRGTIDRNIASGICFVCQQELDSAGLGGDTISKKERETGQEYELSKGQLQVCKKVVEFIKNPEYSNCVENSIQALYLLLRVQWMLYNGRPLSIGREWQKTYLTPEDWVEIYSTCEKYENISGNSVRPVVTLIYALAKIQINKDYLGAVKVMHKISDMPNQRMRVPYLICFEKGKPQKYSGIVVSTHNYSGFIKVDGLPRFSEKNQGVKFFMKNMGLLRMPEKNKLLKNFGLGLSLANSFSAYSISDGGEVE